ncbi:MAG TPA: alkaline phosphatase family protein [Vicinamibacteria bacterium]|nr:alkaline phosphatase family protein [Vicinamibacteria bacterium]
MPSGPFRDLERQLTAAVLAATIATVLLAARNGLAPTQRPLTFGLAFWGAFSATYAALALAAFGLAAFVGILARTSRLRRGLPALVAMAFLAGALPVNGRALRALLALDGPERFRWLPPAALALAALGLVATALDRRRLQRRFAVAAAIAAAVAFWPPAAPATAAPARTARVAAGGQRLLLIGLDGGDWRHMEPLMSRGELPNLQALRARGAHGPLRTFRPTLSPAVWTSIATGRRPSDHGVADFLWRHLRGVGQPYPDLKPIRHVGFPWLEAGLEASGGIATSPVSSVVRRVPAFWNIAAARGSSVDVLNFWATWPAEAVPGHVVSERAYHALVGAREREDGLVFPPALEPELRALAMRPEEVSLADAQRYMDVTAEEWSRRRIRISVDTGALREELPYFHSLYETTRRAALFLMAAGKREEGRAPDQLVLFRLVDMVCHASLAHSELARPGAAGAMARAVTEAYRAMDRAVGDLADAFGEGNVIVISDHGFDVESRGGGLVAHHNRAPDGIFLAAGSAFRPGRVDGLTVFDVLPLLLYLKGWPIADDFAGRVPLAALRPEVVEASPPTRIASYGTREAPSLEARSSHGVDEEMTERLRALGYVQ